MHDIFHGKQNLKESNFGKQNFSETTRNFSFTDLIHLVFGLGTLRSKLKFTAWNAGKGAPQIFTFDAKQEVRIFFAEKACRGKFDFA